MQKRCEHVSGDARERHPGKEGNGKIWLPDVLFSLSRDVRGRVERAVGGNGVGCQRCQDDGEEEWRRKRRQSAAREKTISLGLLESPDITC